MKTQCGELNPSFDLLQKSSCSSNLEEKKKNKWTGQKYLAIKYTVDPTNHFEGPFFSQ